MPDHHVHDETGGGDGVATGVAIDQRDAVPPRYVGVTQRVVLDKATGGNFTLTSGGHTTANIAHNASTAAVATALNALPSVGNAAVDEVQTVTINATGGTFTLAFGGSTTSAIAFDATAGAVQTALRALDTLGDTDVAVTGSAGGPYTVTFGGAQAGRNVAALIADAAGLTGGAGTAVVAQQTAGRPATSGVAVTGTPGDYTIEFVGPPDPTITAADTLTGTGHTIDVITL